MIERTFRRMVNDLENKGQIISFQGPSGNRQKHYRPNLDVIYDELTEEFTEVYDKVDSPSGQIGQVEQVSNDHMLINNKPLTVNTSSNEDVLELTKVKNRKPNQMFDAVAEVCVMDLTLVGSRIAKAFHALAKAGHTPQQMLALTSYWQKTSFQYRQEKKLPSLE